MNNLEKLLDIYFNEKFLKAYEIHEGGELNYFNYKCDYGEMEIFFIKRDLSVFKGGDGFFDITTPYGYGGPKIRDCEQGKEKKLALCFFEAFEEYCEKERIVSFFCRFHPIIQNESYCGCGFDEISLSRRVVVTDMTRDLAEEFTSRAVKDASYAQRKGVSFEIDTAGKYREHFRKMYYHSMHEKHAGENYFFSREYFNYLFDALPENVLLATSLYMGRPICHRMIFIYGDVAYGHLICRDYDYAHFRPNDLTCVQSIEYAKEKGCKYFVSGGGLSNDPNDSLLKYKMKFSTSPLRDFYVGKKVYNQEIYDNICRYIVQLPGDGIDSEFFPKYRSPDSSVTGI